MTDAAPRFSVIITSAASLQEVLTCLSTIIQQSCSQRLEIIVSYSADDASPETIATDYPDVICLRLPRATPLPRLLGVALARATGEIVAITDASCGIDAHWVSAILQAHAGPYPIIGGAVEPDGLRTLVDWAAYFCDYGQFMLPLTEGVVNEVPGNNISIKRWALARGREFVEGEFWKTYWCRRMQAEGSSLYTAPSIVVYYRKSFRLWQYLVHRFHNGRCFAGMRLSQFSQVVRGVYVAASPVLPILFCVRILRAVLPKRRYSGRLLYSFPIIVLATASWALGECVGYLLGPGVSCRHVG
jgi:hypothetical protein